MRFDTVTRAQRLAWQHDETTHGREHDLSLAEQHEVEDQSFRHFDSFIFARGAAAPGSHARERAVVSSSGSSDGGPANSPQPVSPSPQHNGQAGSDAGAVTAPSGRPGVANSSWETWVWTA